MRSLVVHPFLAALLFVSATASSSRAEEVTPLQMGRSVANPGAVEWIGFAVAPRGRVFKDVGNTEVNARQNAKNDCEMSAGSTCKAIAVPSAWDVSAIACGSSSFVAGSNQGAAQERAKQKAVDAGLDDQTCREVYRY